MDDIGFEYTDDELPDEVPYEVVGMSWAEAQALGKQAMRIHRQEQRARFVGSLVGVLFSALVVLLLIWGIVEVVERIFAS